MVHNYGHFRSFSYQTLAFIHSLIHNTFLKYSLCGTISFPSDTEKASQGRILFHKASQSEFQVEIQKELFCPLFEPFCA